ncbi:MAG: helix-turn-helix domain-containing protein [bacterium]
MKKNNKVKANANYYEILDIREDSTRKEIVEAYQKAKSVYNKDSMALYSLYSDDESSNMINLIEEAYQVLINPQRRDFYNKEHNISSNRSIVNIIFDKPGEMKRTFVETPNFKRSGADEDADENIKINKTAFKAYATITKNDADSNVPDYKVSEEMEKKISIAQDFKGEFFAEVRKYKNLSYVYVSNKLKVAVYHIEAIEREDFSALPARVYTRGFLKSYAKLLGFDVDKVVDAYMARFDKSIKK